MSVKVAIDTNIILDLLLEDRPGNAMAKLIFTAAEQKAFKAQITTQSTLDAHYTAMKHGMQYRAFEKAMNGLRTFMEISSIDWIDLSWAMSHYSGDLEDDAQYANAYNSNCDFFITHDKRLLGLNDKFTHMKVISADEFVAQMME